MISTSKHFLFVHVPKTGGNSIQNILVDFSDDTLVCNAAHQDGKERFELVNTTYGTSKHSTLEDYHRKLSRSLYRQLFKFSTIRNPWDWMISQYFSPHRGVSEWNRNAFLRLVQDTPPVSHYIMLRKKNTKRFTNLFRQSKPNDRLDRDIDAILKFETLENDFSDVCKRLDMPMETLPQRNRSERKHYSEYYDDELIEIVRAKFNEEIEFGNYKFQD